MKTIFSSMLLIILSAVLSATVTVDIPCSELSVSRSSGKALFTAEKLGGEAGQPALPVFYVSLLLPPDADLNSVTFAVEGLEETKLEGTYEVSPMLPPTTASGYEGWPDNVTIRNGRDVAVYERDALFPQSRIKNIEVGQLSCFKLVTVEVSQFRYNPVRKELFQMEGGSLKVSYNTTSQGARNEKAKIPNEVVSRLRSKVSNADEFLSTYKQNFTFVDESGLVIIIPSDLKSQLLKFDAFVDSKESMGFTVQVLTESDWGGGTGATAFNNIRGWLQDNYQSQGLNYALIIGSVNINSSKVPMHLFSGYAPSNWPYQDCDSEYGYQQLTGEFKSDYSCELTVGRIPDFSGAEDIDKILQKTIDYTNATEDEAAWRYKALLGGPGYNSSSLIWNPLNEAYHNWIEPNPKWDAWRVYGKRWSSNVLEADVAYPSGDETTFTNEWKKDKFGLVSWGTHGAPTYAENVMSSSQAPGIGNSNPAFVICGSCTNAHSRTNNNLSYSMLKYCAMGAIAGTRETAISEDMVATKYFVRDMAHDSMTIGQTLTDLNNNHSNGWYNRAPMCIYGDPTIGIYSFRTDPFISVTNPKEDDEYIVGAQMNITWSTNTEEPVTITLMDGTTEVLTIADGESNDKEYSWTIPADVENSSKYVIRIESNGITGESKTFKIKKKPSILLGVEEFNVSVKPDDTKETKLNVKNEGGGGLNYKVKLKGGNASLLINEIFTPYNEFFDGFEIWNRGTDCDLKGYTIEWTDNQQTSGSYTFDESFPLLQGETVILADAAVTGKHVVVDVNLAWSCKDDALTEIAITVLDPDGECVDFFKTAGSTTAAPGDHWSGAGVAVGSQRLYRKQNDDSNSAADWTSAEGEESVNTINNGQSMDGVGQYWVKCTPASGVVESISDIDLTVVFDANGVSDTLYDTLVIIHDDPDTESPIFVPCKMIVGGTAVISTMMNSIQSFNIAYSANRVTFQVPQKFADQKVQIDLYNLQGRRVKSLVNETMKAGVHTIQLSDGTGRSSVASGIYLCRMKATGFTKTVRMSVHK